MSILVEAHEDLDSVTLTRRAGKTLLRVEPNISGDPERGGAVVITGERVVLYRWQTICEFAESLVALAVQNGAEVSS